MERVLKETLDALVPIYTEEGSNSTCIKHQGGDLVVQKSIKTVLKKLCSYYHYDLKTSNKDYGTRVNLKKTIPIPLRRDMIFIGVKTRSPLGKDDGAFSYINIESIRGVKKQKIYFKSGDSLETQWKDGTIEKHIKLARLLKDSSLEKSSLVREVGPDYRIDSLELKEDLLLIYKKLEKIEERLSHY